MCLSGRRSTCQSFTAHRGVRQGCEMHSWLFNLFVDGIVREMKTKAGNDGN